MRCRYLTLILTGVTIYGSRWYEAKFLFKKSSIMVVKKKLLILEHRV